MNPILIRDPRDNSPYPHRDHLKMKKNLGLHTDHAQQSARLLRGRFQSKPTTEEP